MLLDINECRSGANSCDGTYADCANTPGSYTCTCKSGLSGDGQAGNCLGTYYILFLMIFSTTYSITFGCMFIKYS